MHKSNLAKVKVVFERNLGEEGSSLKDNIPAALSDLIQYQEKKILKRKYHSFQY